ncbi:hypothetical protein Tco_0257698 [Tanacetum coccineum]
MLPVLAVDQMYVPFIHRTSVVSVLAPMETMLYLLHSYSLPPEKTSCFLPPEELAASLPPEETSCFLPPEETSCFLPPKETSCFLPPEETSYSLVIASGPERPRPEAVRARSEAVRALPEVQSGVFWVSFGGSIGGARTSIGDTLLTGDWFSFAKRGDPAPVCMEVAKFGLKLWKENFFLIDRRAIPFHMPWRHPDSCIIDKVPTSFIQNHTDQLKAHIVKLRDISEGALVQSGLSRGWRNPMCDLVLRLMSIYDFLCMPSLDKVTIREEPHRLDTSILGRVADRTTSPALAGTVIPRASLEEIAVTHPGRKVVTKAYHAAKRKASTGPEISTNATKKTRSSKKGSGAGSSGQSAGDGVEQADDGTLVDDDQRDDAEFAMEGMEGLNNVSQDKEVEPDVERSRGVRRTTRASFRASHGISEDVSPRDLEAAPALDAQPLDADVDVDEIASDDNVNPYYEAPVEGSKSESPTYTKDDWKEFNGVNLDLQKKELYKDPKACRIALDRFPTPAETHRLRELSSFDLADRMRVLQCQLITHESMLNARYDHSLKNVERLSKQCAQQTQIIKKQSVGLKKQNESTVRANEEVSRLTAQLGVLLGIKLIILSTAHKLQLPVLTS